MDGKNEPRSCAFLTRLYWSRLARDAAAFCAPLFFCISAPVYITREIESRVLVFTALSYFPSTAVVYVAQMSIEN